jgi:hypothetical protein
MARTSRYFEQTLFYERSPAADEYYHRLADVIFEKSAKQAKIEVRIQSPHDLAFYVRQNGTSTTQRRPNKDFETDARKPSRRIENTGSTWNAPAVYTTQTGPSWEEDNCSLSTASSCASSTAVPMGLDQHRGVSTPPSYPGPPKLTILDLDTSQLHKFLKVCLLYCDFVTTLTLLQTTKNDFRVLYVPRLMVEMALIILIAIYANGTLLAEFKLHESFSNFCWRLATSSLSFMSTSSASGREMESQRSRHHLYDTDHFTQHLAICSVVSVCMMPCQTYCSF